VPISAALRQGPQFKAAAVASRWQRVGDLIGSEFEPIPPVPEADVFVAPERVLNEYNEDKFFV